MRRGGRARITARVEGEARCGVEVYYTATGRTATDKELEVERSPEGGVVGWEYDVGTSRPGTARITVTCGPDSRSKEARVR
jgi:hypothetical protein